MSPGPNSSASPGPNGPTRSPWTGSWSAIWSTTAPCTRASSADEWRSVSAHGAAGAVTFPVHEHRKDREVMTIALIVIVVVIVLLLLYVIAAYNGLVRLRNRVENAWAQIDVQLKRRLDLVPNLVETVKGYAAHERQTLDAVVQARNAGVAAQGPQQEAEASNMLTGALRQLFALSEAYPDL